MSPSQCPFPGCSPVCRVVCACGNPPQLFGLPGIELEVVPLAPVHRVLNKFSVGSFIPVPDEADDSRVVRELLQMAVG